MYVIKQCKSETYADRNKSYLVIEMMNISGCKKKTIADALDITVPYLNNKLSRNSFSFDDLVKIANACDFELWFHRPGTYPITVEIT